MRSSAFLRRAIRQNRGMVRLRINGEEREVEGVDPSTPLLWVLRDTLQLTGTKYGCGRGLCGTCTVHLDGAPARACLLPVSAADGKSVTTIEGVAPEGELSTVQQAWIEAQVPQCGYCQSGQIMAATKLLEENPAPTDADIDEAMTNLCRCGTYPEVRAAIKLAAEKQTIQRAEN